MCVCAYLYTEVRRKNKFKISILKYHKVKMLKIIFLHLNIKGNILNSLWSLSLQVL